MLISAFLFPLAEVDFLDFGSALPNRETISEALEMRFAP